MSLQRAWGTVTYDGANVCATQLRAETQWLHANAYVQVDKMWCRVDMRGRAVTEYPQSLKEWREYCDSVVAVFSPESVTA